MSRKVKCQITHEIGSSDNFYKAPNGKYYKSEQIYNSWRREVNDRNECIRLICEYADYKNGEYAPTFLNKMISDFGKKVGYDVLLETIQECDKEFRWANNNKEFNNEIGRLFYYKSIIGNHIIDVYQRSQRMKELEKKIESTSNEVFENIENIGCSIGKGKDLSGLLGDLEWSYKKL